MEDILEIFATNLNKMMDQRGENLTQLSNRIGVAYSTVSDWQHGRKMPRTASLQKLADHFNVNVTYLTSNHADGKKGLKIADLKDDTVIFTYGGKPLSDEDWELIRRLMNRN